MSLPFDIDYFKCPMCGLWKPRLYEDDWCCLECGEEDADDDEDYYDDGWPTNEDPL